MGETHTDLSHRHIVFIIIIIIDRPDEGRSEGRTTTEARTAQEGDGDEQQQQY